MMKELVRFDNAFGAVVILQENIGFTVQYSARKMPGVYRCRVCNTNIYDVALSRYNHYVGLLKRKETLADKNNQLR